MLRALACVLALALAGGAATASHARTEASALIRPGKSIGKVSLGMTVAQVRRALGRPDVAFTRRGGFGLRTVEYQYGYGSFTVRFAARAGRLRVVRIGTALARERTPAGVGPGSLERTLRRAHPGVRCERLQTQRHGSVALVTTIQRECTLSAGGGRTIFVSDVQERMFEVITPAMWARRARVIEVGVAVAT